MEQEVGEEQNVGVCQLSFYNRCPASRAGIALERQQATAFQEPFGHGLGCIGGVGLLGVLFVSARLM